MSASGYTTFPFGPNITIFCYTSLLSVACIKSKQLLEGAITTYSVTIASVSKVPHFCTKKPSPRGHRKVALFKFSNTPTSWYLPSLAYFFCGHCYVKSTMLNGFIRGYCYRIYAVRVTSNIAKLCSQRLKRVITGVDNNFYYQSRQMFFSVRCRIVLMLHKSIL